MSQLTITENAVTGLERCRLFLASKNKLSSKKAAQTISHHLKLLQNDPKIGRPLDDYPELRELIIPFGSSGYTALYRCSEKENSVFILSFKHQKEVYD